MLDLQAPVFELSPQQIGRRVNAAAKAAGLGEGFTGHSGRVGMAQDLANTGTELPALMTAGRWKNSKMPARYTERQAAGRALSPDITRKAKIRLPRKQLPKSPVYGVGYKDGNSNHDNRSGRPQRTELPGVTAGGLIPAPTTRRCPAKCSRPWGPS